MKKKKEYSLFTKIRSALRDIWRYSPHHREAIKKATMKADSLIPTKTFFCTLCNGNWPIELASVDHQPPCGPLQSWDDLVPFSKTLFEGSVRVICKPCHKRVTASQRKKAK